jgi:hypothetical protein
MLYMNRGTARLSALVLLRAAAVVTAIVLIYFSASDAFARTLTEAKASEWSLPPPSAKARSPSSGHLRSCSSYGAGFAAIPGTDACVKVGGFTSVETGTH